MNEYCITCQELVEPIRTDTLFYTSLRCPQCQALIDVMKQKIKWYSVKDDPPPDKTCVLVRYESGHVKVAAWYDFQKAWFTPSNYVMTPHEWMEIPE